MRARTTSSRHSFPPPDFTMKPLLTLASWSLWLATAQADPPRFSEHLIGAGYSYSFGIATADIDGDGDLDISSADALPNNRLYWYQNNGQGTFQRHIVQRDDPQRLERHALADIAVEPPAAPGGPEGSCGDVRAVSSGSASNAPT